MAMNMVYFCIILLVFEKNVYFLFLRCNLSLSMFVLLKLSSISLFVCLLCQILKDS